MSRKRGKDKRAAKQAVPEEILAEGSGPNEIVEANAQSLADAASDALGPVADVEVHAEGGPAPSKKQGQQPKKQKRATTDAWGQPIEVDADEESSQASDDIEATGEVSADAEADVEAGTDAELAIAEVADEAATKGRGKKSKRKAKATKRSTQSADESELADTGDAESTGGAATGEEVSAASDGARATEESPEGAFAEDDALDDATMQAEPGELTAEAQSEQALEDAVMRAEAEAELGEGEEPAEGDDVELEGVVGAALPTTAASMDAAQLKNLVEALVFAADKPVTLQRLRQLTRVSDVKRLEEVLAAIAADYKDRGIALQQVSGGYQFRTNTQYSVWVQQLIAGRPVRLSRAQLETLAIVAYRQPITRPEVDEIRGVDSSATLRLLLDRSLIRVLGKKEDVGRPTLYGTTKEFLDFFSLSDLRELPTLREYSELTAESRKVMSDRLGIDADGNAVEDEADVADDAEAPTDASAAPDASDVAAVVANAGASENVEVDVDVQAQLAADDAAAVEAVSAVTGDVVGIIDADSMDVVGGVGEASVDELAGDESIHASDEQVAAVDASSIEHPSSDDESASDDES
ncbi:MAG TPA: SMC-Scp complex subunit ScpB, partial [Kofleriaceae bacterium]|nr:SMC-Scp complex subunit ScpB [Kofleriaceae bacterium]